MNGGFGRQAAPAWGFLGAQFAFTGVLRASGNMVVTMVLTLVSQWVLQFPLAYVLSKHTALGMQGIWWAFPAANVTIDLNGTRIINRKDPEFAREGIIALQLHVVPEPMEVRFKDIEIQELAP